MNDNPPEFEKTVYSLHVIESAPVGFIVGRVFATSRDFGINAQITYSVISSIGSDFTIDPDTGMKSENLRALLLLLKNHDLMFPCNLHFLQV
ncbi:MAG: cadherin repeat domain-containing protein [Leptospira sp.]|nr:cadherin repeat domain-containing protein [Leptospira sp.]